MAFFDDDFCRKNEIDDDDIRFAKTSGFHYGSKSVTQKKEAKPLPEPWESVWNVFVYLVTVALTSIIPIIMIIAGIKNDNDVGLLSIVFGYSIEVYLLYGWTHALVEMFKEKKKKNAKQRSKTSKNRIKTSKNQK